MDIIMLKHFHNQLKFGQFRKKMYRYSKPQDHILIGVANNNRVPTFKYLKDAPFFKASSMKRACFWRFLLNNCVQI